MIITNFWDFRSLAAGPGAPLGPGGYPAWPVTAVFPVAPPITTWQLTFPVEIETFNGGSADAVTGVDEFDWYLQEPCELVDFGAKRLELQEWTDELPTNSYSGRKRLALTAAGTAFLTVQDPRTMKALFEGVYLFARQTTPVSPNIYVYDLLRAAFEPNSYIT